MVTFQNEQNGETSDNLDYQVEIGSSQQEEDENSFVGQGLQSRDTESEEDRVINYDFRSEDEQDDLQSNRSISGDISPENTNLLAFLKKNRASQQNFHQNGQNYGSESDQESTNSNQEFDILKFKQKMSRLGV